MAVCWESSHGDKSEMGLAVILMTFSQPTEARESGGGKGAWGRGSFISFELF